MMKRQLQLFGSPVLSTKASELPSGSGGEMVDSLLEDMFRILAEEEGLGLAAPQAGESLRVFVLDPASLPSVDGHDVFINPVVELSGGTVRREEGCLSLPGIYEDVPRFEEAAVTALGRDLEEFRITLSGLAARAVQHELDHLDGLLIVDRISPIRRRLLRGKLREIRQEAGKRGQL